MNKNTSLSLQQKLAAIGPGILFAAAAVGVSHLVQATRAGALYGLSMGSIIILACLIKYPGIRFGSEYAAATGKSLIHSYRKTGRWAIWLYILAQATSMVFVVAAVSLLTAGLTKSVLGVGLSDIGMVSLLLAGCTGLLISGRYALLEKLLKLVVPLFTLLILAASLLVIGRIQWSWGAFAWPELNAATLMFIVIMGGFMPAPLDSSVLQSLWTETKNRNSGQPINPRQTRFDFNLGFFTTLVLALCFMLLGSAVMHSNGVAPAAGAQGFASQVINLFTETTGAWVYPFVAAAAIAVMLSTMLTLLDGSPRIAAAIVKELSSQQVEKIAGVRVYDLVIVLLAIAAIGVLAAFLESFKTFIDLVSAIVFIVGPLIAWLNHKAVFDPELQGRLALGTGIRLWSQAGIMLMTLAGLAYCYLVFIR
ncbi:NRAMP family divalent metal transporter [Porticoccus sp. GXU_MW_L64]